MTLRYRHDPAAGLHEAVDLLIVTKMDRLGRPWTLDEAQRAEVRAAISAGASVSAMAKQLAVSRQTVMRARDENLN